MSHSEFEQAVVTAAPLSPSAPAVTSDKVWACLLTNKNYFQGLLALDFALKKVGSAYPFVALYTDSVPQECHDALDERGIPSRKIPYLVPGATKDWGDNPHYQDCWTKLAIFSLMEYSRVILLDLDMIVIRNMDELMDLPMHGAPFAACPGCSCNPAQRPQSASSWPALWRTIKSGGWGWKPEACGWTSQHAHPRRAHLEGPSIKTCSPAVAGGPEPNAGLLIVEPDLQNYARLITAMQDGDMISKFNFPEQDLMAWVFQDTWLTLPYIYNAVKTMRWEGVHDAIWDDTKVKNIHFICKQKPWSESLAERKNFAERDPLHEIWWAVEGERVRVERELGIKPYVL